MGTVPAAQAQKSMCEDSAFQKGLELVFDKLGPARPGFLFDLGKEGVDVVLDDLVEDGVFRPPAFVGSRRTMGDSLTGLGGRPHVGASRSRFRRGVS